MKFKALLLALAATCVSFTASAYDGKEIRFGTEASYPPFESRTPSGELVGFDVDLGNAICAKLNVKCVWVENAFDGMIPALQAKKFDAINSSMGKNEKRMKVIDFTEKLYAPYEALVVKDGSKLQTTADSLKGKRIGALQGSTTETYARKYWEASGVEVVTYQTADQVWADLVTGRIDGAVVYGPQALYGFLDRPQGKGYGFATGPAIHDPSIFGVGVSIGVRKGDKALLDALNSAIEGIRADGTYDRIAKKYFKFDIYNGTP